MGLRANTNDFAERCAQNRGKEAKKDSSQKKRRKTQSVVRNCRVIN